MSEEPKYYKYGEWGVRNVESPVIVDLEERIYEDNDGNLITGILENFWYYGEGDSRNQQYVENGRLKR